MLASAGGAARDTQGTHTSYLLLSNPVYGTCRAAGTTFSALQTWTHAIYRANRWASYYHLAYFTNEETETQRYNVLPKITPLGSHRGGTGNQVPWLWPWDCVRVTWENMPGHCFACSLKNKGRRRKTSWGKFLTNFSGFVIIHTHTQQAY